MHNQTTSITFSPYNVLPKWTTETGRKINVTIPFHWKLPGYNSAAAIIGCLKHTHTKTSFNVNLETFSIKELSLDLEGTQTFHIFKRFKKSDQSNEDETKLTRKLLFVPITKRRAKKGSGEKRKEVFLYHHFNRKLTYIFLNFFHINGNILLRSLAIYQSIVEINISEFR